MESSPPNPIRRRFTWADLPGGVQDGSAEALRAQSKPSGCEPFVKDQSGSLLLVRDLSKKLVFPSGSIAVGAKESETLAIC